MWAALACVLIVELSERLAYYGLTASYRYFLQNVHSYSGGSTTGINLSFNYTAYLMCIAGGFAADTSFGRFKTIMTFSIIYVIGMIACAIFSFPTVAKVVGGEAFIGALFCLVGVGTGGIKPNVCNFGADQIDPDDPAAESVRQGFFLYFYMAINSGALVAYLFLSQVAMAGIPSIGIEKKFGYATAYTFAATCMTISVIIFAVGIPLYRKASFQTADKPALGQIMRTIATEGGVNGIMLKIGYGMFLPFSIVQYWAVVNAVAADAVPAWSETAHNITSWVTTILLFAPIVLSGRDTAWMKDRECAQLFMVFPACLCAHSAFSQGYNASMNVFQDLACHMDTRLLFKVSGIDFQVNGVTIGVADCLSILMGTPIIERVFLPAYKSARGVPPGVNTMVTLGVGCECIALATAAAIDYWRVTAPKAQNFPNPVCASKAGDGTRYPVADLNLAWMIIPYCFVGWGQIFNNPTMNWFVYENVPASMKSTAQALNMFFQSGISSGVSGLVHGTMKGNLDGFAAGTSTAYVYMLAFIGCSGVFLGIFYFAAAPIIAQLKQREDKTTFADPSSLVEMRIYSHM